MRRLRWVCTALVATCLCMCLPSIATASFGIETWRSQLLTTPAPGGTAVENSQAGARSDFQALIGLGRGKGTENPRELVVDLPPGLVGSTADTPKCTPDQLAGAQLSDPDTGCPAASQVGVIELFVDQAPGRGDASTQFSLPAAPVFNMTPSGQREAARLAFVVAAGGNLDPVTTFIEPRTEGDYGLQARIPGIIQFYQVITAKLTLWGVPTDPRHDAERYAPGLGSDGPLRPNPGQSNKAFLSSPTRCGVSLLSRLAAESYADSRSSAESVFTSGLTGCDLVPFDPSLSVSPTESTQADAPSGYGVNLQVPQSQDARTKATSHLQRTEVALPEGVALNAGVAAGLGACSDTELRADSRDAAACPNSAKIGRAEIDVPILGGSLEGGLYVRPQTADETYRVALVASGLGVNVKLPGVVRPDPATGRVTAIFDQTPQVPFSDVRIKIDGGPRGALANPPTCGSPAALGQLTPWSGTGVVSITSPAPTISWDGAGAPCPASLPFLPTLAAGTSSALAGRTSPLSVRLQREDRNQEVGAADVNLPLGLSAIAKNLPLCDLGRAAAGTCGATSRIGSLVVGAGAGSSPFYVRGSAYLTQAYKGGAYGMSFVIPVVAGPFDLGTVVVQAKVSVDPVTAQLGVSTDPLPRIVRGIPLRVRDIRLDVDRPRFTLTPTNCKTQRFTGRVSAVQGASVLVGSPFQASACSRLYYKPKVSLALRGRGETTDGRHPALAAVVRQRQGSANISKVEAVLPSSLALDADNAQGLCKFEDGQKVRCPKSSIVGRAKITTPLLNRPLRGPVYFVENQRRNKFGRIVKTLPTLLLTLRGEVALNIRAKSAVAGGRNLVTTFSGLPDQPFSRFDLFINGGKNGILAANTNLCKANQTARLETDAQSGARSDPEVRVGTPCGRRGAK